MKKFWQRSKSRVRGSQSERSSSGIGPQASTKVNAASRNAPAVPAVPERSANRTSGADSSSRPNSGNRMQPMLVGISRSSGGWSRPGTGGSLQNAVDQAANQVAQTSSSEFYKGHSRTRSPRYVDIFATQNPKSSKTSYNEDVAARNLDVKRAAEGSVQHSYVPSSKYQEEVAARNAHGQTKSLGQVSYENLPPHREAPRSTAMESGYQIPPNKLADEDDIRKLHEAQLASLRQPRPWSGPKSGPRPGSAQRSDVQPAQAVQPRLSSRPLSDAQRPYESMHSADKTVNRRRRSSDPSGSSDRGREAHEQPVQPFSTSGLNTVVATSPLPGYQLSQSELRQRDSDSRAPSQPASLHRPAYTDRSMSNASTASSARKAINLQNRTIMDLTGEEDDTSVNDYVGSNGSNTPAVEGAHVNSFRRMYPDVDRTRSLDQQRNADEGVPQRQTEEATSLPSSVPITGRASPQSHQPISFSTINTVASFSPSRHVNGETPPSNDKMMSSPSKIGVRGQSKLYTLSETEPETDEFATPAEEPIEYLSRFPSLAKGKGKARAISAEEDSVADRLSSSPASVETQRPPVTATSTPQNIQMSPESLQSRDFVEPSRAFGVLTRDFAVTPTKLMPNPRSDQVPNTKAKVQHRVPVPNNEVTRAVGSPIANGTSDMSSSTFDEEGFQRRKDEARAALIKLQQSLNEDFATPPRIPRKPVNSARYRAVSTSPGPSNRSRPMQPATFSPQVYDYQASQPQVNGDIQARGSSYKQQSSAPDGPSGSARPASAASVVTVRPIHQQRSASAQSRDRKREVASALDDMRRIADEMRNPRLAHSLPPAPPAVQKLNNTNINRFSSSTNSTNSSDVVPSPGELSLSNFPAPASVQHSRHPSLVLPIQNPADSTPPDSNRNSAQAPLEQVTETNDENEAPAPGVPYYHGSVTTPPPKTHVSHLQQDAQHEKLPPASTSAPRAVSQSPVLGPRKTLSRRGSTQSAASTHSSSSQHSIPYHLIPERGSSMRDSLVREVDEEI